MEYLAAHRVAAFVDFVQKNDMQITANRRTGSTLFQDCILRSGDASVVVTLGNDKFDKLLTYLSQNDLQVHGADASSTVGIYAFVKIVAELRRSLRSYGDEGLPTVGLADASARPPSSPALDRFGFSPAKRVERSREAGLRGEAGGEERPSASRTLFPTRPLEDAPVEKVEGLKGAGGVSRETPFRPTK